MVGCTKFADVEARSRRTDSEAPPLTVSQNQRSPGERDRLYRRPGDAVQSWSGWAMGRKSSSGMPSKSVALTVYRGSPLAMAVAAIMPS